jgi:Scaffold protein Nfu/NifU N terminal
MKGREIVSAPLTVTVQPTPNVNALKFVVNRRVTEGRSQTFTDAATASAPLARELLGIAGIRQVFFLNDFITLTRTEGADWNAVVPAAELLIRQHLA